jgi:hypothetical protein
VILKYFSFIFVVLIIFFVTSIFIKPIPVSEIKKESYSKYSRVVKNIYAKVLFKDFKNLKTYDEKISSALSVVKYNSKYREVYDDICSNLEKYYSDFRKEDVLRIIKTAIKSFNIDKYVDCYIRALAFSKDYALVLSFLEKEHEKTKDPYRKALILERIYYFKDKKNIDLIKKSVRDYHKEKNKMPEHIVILYNEGYLEEMPQDPYGGQYYIDLSGNVKSTSVRGDK